MGKKYLGRKDVIYLLIISILIVFFILSHIQNFMESKSKEESVEKLKNLYRMLTERGVEVLNVKDEGNLYRVILRLKLNTGDVLKDVYVTKDGKFFSENIMNITNFEKTLIRQKNFTECLKSKGVLIFGQKNEPNTMQQLLILGNYANKIFVDCSGANLQICQRLGIETIPTILYNNMNYTGVKSIAWFETLTGCRY